jgi:NAD(P)-dependent dehydrogenase (short-subunit alcohol dehydrogenase family)
MIPEDPLELERQVAFITGGGQNVGRAIALAFARHNAGGIAVNDFVLERAEAVAAEIRALGVPAIAVQADVGDYESVRAAFAAATRSLGAITVLVNNAGNAGPAARMGLSPPFWETEPRDWDRYFHTNTIGVLNCCHVALPEMVRRKHGRILTIVSDAGRIGEARLAAYSAAKAAAGGFVRAIARETGRFGITCNAISLGTIEPSLDAEAMDRFLASDHIKTQLSHYVIRRFGKPDEVALMALFLCSRAASWITGQTYPVNGGYSFAQ